MIKFGYLAEFNLVIWHNIVWSFGKILNMTMIKLHYFSLDFKKIFIFASGLSN